MIIGVVGSTQSGLVESQIVLEQHGFVVCDLGDVATQQRLVNPRVRGEYRRYGLLGRVGPNGELTEEYGEAVIDRLDVHAALARTEQEAVAMAVPSLLEAHAGKNVALVWGYLHLILTGLPPLDHILFLHPREEVLLRRVKARLIDLGASTADDNQIIAQLIVIARWPGRIEAELSRQAGAPVTTIDTSGDDWGAAALRRVLQTLR